MRWNIDQLRKHEVKEAETALYMAQRRLDAAHQAIADEETKLAEHRAELAQLTGDANQ